MEDSEKSAIYMQAWMNTYVRPVKPQEWDGITANRCVEMVSAKTNLAATTMVPTKDFPVFYLFRADPGFIGICQISRLPNGQNGLTVRYKFVTESGTNALFFTDEFAEANRPKGTNPIPREAAQLFNQARESQAALYSLIETQTRPAKLQQAKLAMQGEETQRKLTALLKGTVMEAASWERAKISRQREQLDPQKDRAKYVRMYTESAVAHFQRRTVDGRSGCSGLDPPGKPNAVWPLARNAPCFIHRPGKTRGSFLIQAN